MVKLQNDWAIGITNPLLNLAPFQADPHARGHPRILKAKTTRHAFDSTGSSEPHQLRRTSIWGHELHWDSHRSSVGGISDQRTDPFGQPLLASPQSLAMSSPIAVRVAVCRLANMQQADPHARGHRVRLYCYGISGELH